MGAGGSALGLLVATGALTKLLFGPLWDSVPDRVGRKPILMVGMLGYGHSMSLFELSTELWMLFASGALSGVLSAATLATAMAYIGVSSPVCSSWSSSARSVRATSRQYSACMPRSSK